MATTMTTTSSILLSTITSPMVSVFTPPASCSTHWTYEGATANGISGGLLLQDAQFRPRDTPCYPPGFDGWGRAPSFIQVFSPGACPSGYTTAGNVYDGATTTAVCCLSNFLFVSTVSTVNAGHKTAQYFGCTSVYQAYEAVTTVFAEVGGTSAVLDGTATNVTSVSGPVTMWAQPITVAYQQSDLHLFTTTSTSQGPSSSTTSTKSSSTTVPPTTSTSLNPQTSPPATASGSLSDGTIAGIAVGAAAVLGVLIGGAIFFRRKRKSSDSSPRPRGSSPGWNGPGRTQDWQHGYEGKEDPAWASVHGEHGRDATGPKFSEAGGGSPKNWVAELSTNVDRRYELS